MKNLILFTFCLLSFSLFGQKNNLANWTTYQHPEEVNDIAETATDIWFATNKGVVQMNKNTFEKTYYNSSNSPLPSDHIQALAMDADGQLFIGTYDNIMARFGGGDDWEIIDVPYEEGFPGEMPRLYDILIGQENIIWVGNGNGLLRYSDEEWIVYGSENSTNQPVVSFRDVWDIAQTDNGDVYAASFDLYKFDGNTFTNLNEDNPEFFSYGGSRLDSKGDEIWFSNEVPIAGLYKEGEWQNIYDAEDGDLPNGVAVDIKIDNDGVPHLLYNNYLQDDPLLKLENDVWVAVVDEQVDAIQSPAKQLFFDEDGNRWLTERSKVSSISNDDFVQIELNQSPLTKNSAAQIKITPDGTTYIYTNFHIYTSLDIERKLVKFNTSNEWEEIELPTDAGVISDFVVNDEGDIFLTLGQCIYQYTNEEWICISFPTTAAPKKLAINSQNELWVTTSTYGLFHYDGENWEHFLETTSGLNDNYVRQLVIDREDNVWVVTGFEYDLNRFDGENWEIFSSSNSPFPGGTFVNTPYFDANNEMWIPISDLGVYHFDGENWEMSVTSDDETPYLGQVNSDLQNGLYMSSEQGIYQYDGEIWQPFLNVDNSLLHENETSNFVVDNEGFFYISTSNGLAIYDSEIVSAINDPKILDQSFFTISPNPATDFISITLEDVELQSLDANIYDATGRLLRNEKVNIGEQMRVMDLSKGIYYLKLDGGEKSYIGKFVKE
jgi:ligand-binding sensor domain-containing protein